MATLSLNAQKLLKYLNIYRLTPTDYANRISGTYPYDYWYNSNWFIGTLDQGGEDGRYLPSPQKGIFKSALSELLGAGY